MAIQIEQKVFVEFTEPIAVPIARVRVPPEYTLTGGGAIALWEYEGSLLTASYPIKNKDEAQYSVWEGRAKQHIHPDPSPLLVYAIGIRLLDKGNPIPLTQVVAEATSVKDHPVPTVRVELNDATFVLTGGGAFADWDMAGSLLTASFPTTQGGGAPYTGWEARSKQHIEPDPSTITAYAIGIKVPKAAGVNLTQRVVVVATNNPVGVPTGEAFLDDTFVLTGGGAIDNWDTEGNLLTASLPMRRPKESNYRGWNVRGKQHIRTDASFVTCYAIGIKTV
jgi:hypothetical protein